MREASAGTAEGIARRADPGFKHTLYKFHHGDTLRFCYQCGTCTANCPIAQFVRAYRPNKMLEFAKLGIRDQAYGNAYLLCSACTLCTKNCPQGVRVHEVMNALKDLAVEDEAVHDYMASGFGDMLAALGEEMPFPIAYAWICLRPSEEEPGRGKFDRLATEVLTRSLLHAPKAPDPLPRAAESPVAVIGSGPAGLTAAWALARRGYPVTVFEALSEAGGMLRVGIPAYRLPKEIVVSEIEKIRALGVEIRTNAPVDQAMFDELLRGGQYRAVFVATGAHTNRKIRIEGEELDGVVPVLDFLRRYNLGEIAEVAKRVVVIGGGNVAIDAARAAVRLGAETVRLFCLESREEMPSHDWEINEAAAEGVQLNPCRGPKRILGEGGRAAGVEFVRCKSVFDEKGKFSPVYDEKTAETAQADWVISAIGQGPDLGYLGKSVEISRGVVAIDPYTLETSMPRVFAGGDAATGTASLVEALLAGRTAAASIASCLENPAGGEHS